MTLPAVSDMGGCSQSWGCYRRYRAGIYLSESESLIICVRGHRPRVNVISKHLLQACTYLPPLPHLKHKQKKIYQATATPRACYVCSKPSTTCLATIHAVDFIYTCDSHLSDTGFATEIVDSNGSKQKEGGGSVSPEEIARIKAEWEAKEARKKKKDKDKDKDKETAAADGGSGEGKKGDEGKDKAAPSPSSVPGTPSSPSVTIPTYKRYSLHRDFYAMRQAEHRRRKKTTQMQELAPRLPGAPQGSLQ